MARGGNALLRSWLYSRKLLCQLSYRSARAPGGTRTRDLSIRIDNRNCSGPQQVVRRGRGMRSGLRSRTAAAREDRSAHEITEPLRPATMVQTGPPGIEPGPTRLELAVLPITPRAFVRAVKSLRQESNPHYGRTKGACLPLTLRRRDGDGGSRTRSSSVQTRCSSSRATSPRCGRMESNHHSTRRRVYSAGSSPLLSVRVWGDRPGSNRRRGAHNPGCFRLHHGHHEAGTTGLEPAASRLTSECSARLSYAPR